MLRSAFSLSGLYGRGDKRLSSDVDTIETMSSTAVAVYLCCSSRVTRR